MNKENVPTENGAAGFPLKTVVSCDVTESLRKISGDIAASFKAIFLGMAGRAEEMAEGFRSFGDAYYNMAEQTYKFHNGKLPGSTKTKRMKKKRKVVVLVWFSNYLKTGGCSS